MNNKTELIKLKNDIYTIKNNTNELISYNKELENTILNEIELNNNIPYEEEFKILKRTINNIQSSIINDLLPTINKHINE